MTRFFDFDGQKIPLRKDEASEIYVERADGTPDPKPLTTLLGDGAWLVNGAVFTTNRLGERTQYQVTRVEFEIDVHQNRGRYGQLRRRVLVVQHFTNDEVASELMGGGL